jgi:hypothetical protein
MARYPRSDKDNLFVPVGAADYTVLPSKDVAQYEIAPLADDAEAFLEETALTAEVQTITAFDGEVDVPRQILITTGNATMAGDIVLTGTDFNGDTLTETVSMVGDDGLTEYLATKMFASITQVVLPIQTAPGDTVAIGSTDVVGFPFIYSENTVFLVTHDGTIDSTYTMAANADKNKCTFEPTSALDGNTINVYFLA